MKRIPYMIFRLIFLFVSASVYVVGASLSHSEGLPSEPKELNELLGRSVGIRQEQIDRPISERRTALAEKYVAALEKALLETSQAGDLDAAVELKEEISRMDEGKPLTKQYSTVRVNALAKTFVEYSGKVDREEVELRRSFARKLSDALGGLQSDLTKQARVEDAILVKKFREGAGFLDVVVGEGMMNSGVRSALASAFNAGSSGLPSESSAGGEPVGATRVVLIPMSESAVAPAIFQKVQEADMTDIVGVGRTLFPNLGMFRSDGSLVYWKDGEDEPEIVPGSVIFCDQSYECPLAGLNRDGTVSCSSDASPDLIQSLRSATDVIHLRATSAVISLVKKNGSIELFGSRRGVPTPAFMAGMSDVREVEFAGAAFASVLKSDGSVIEISNGTALEAQGKGKVRKLHAHGIGEDSSGKLLSWGAFSVELLEEAGRKPKSIFSVSRRFAALRRDGSFFLSTSNDQGRWEEQKKYAEALDGAVAFTWLIGTNEDWILAVVPADSVSRSGVWKVEELAEERDRS